MSVTPPGGDDLGPFPATRGDVPGSSRAADDAPARPADPLGVLAIVLGCLGIVVVGIVLGVVTAVVASIAGAKAREEGRPLDNAYIAWVLAAVDGAVWIALHLMFDISFLYG